MLQFLKHWMKPTEQRSKLQEMLDRKFSYLSIFTETMNNIKLLNNDINVEVEHINTELEKLQESREQLYTMQKENERILENINNILQ